MCYSHGIAEVFFGIPKHKTEGVKYAFEGTCQEDKTN